MANFFIENYGCQMNVSEADSLATYLEKSGHKRVKTPDKADFVIINTCSVRESAEERIIGRLGYYRGLKNRINPDIKVILMGCMAQYAGEKLREEFSDVLKVVWGTYNKDKVVEILNLYDRYTYTDMKEYKFTDAFPQKKFPFKSFLPISHGCNNFCSYCIVPYLRGREICRNSDEVVENIKRLVEVGVKEVTLLGQNVNSYFDGKYSFSELLERIINETSLKRLTFLTSHPKDFSKQIVDVMESSKRILRYIHLPLQSGNNRILGLMNRKYTVEEYLEKIELIRRIQDVVISTDIIVGFPSETEKEFMDTIEVVKKIGFNEAYMYYYNPRPYAKASEFEGQIPEVEKKRRLSYLIEVQNSIKAQLLTTYVGKEYNLLIESVSKKNKSELLGRTDNNLIVFVDGRKDLIGSIVRVKIEALKDVVLKGRIIF
ncbi:MAG: tRNA (N6-isopentenyl adenosine(37)-C2)-methylthiotransferase MiaB [Brevinematia bacterium]